MMDTLHQYQEWFRAWANTTQVARQRFLRDYNYVEGNGKHWRPADRQRVEASGRPPLEYNLILPQFQYLAGLQRDLQVGFRAVARGIEDRRLGEVANAVLRAAFDFGKLQRPLNKIFDDASICGLGVLHLYHTLEDVEDILWGDIRADRIHPASFIYDPWISPANIQDATFCGHASWVPVSLIKERYPQFAHLAIPGEWLGSTGTQGASVGDSLQFGLGPNLLPELWDQESGRVRILTLWHKVPHDMIFLADSQTGMVESFNTRRDADAELERIKGDQGRAEAAKYQIIKQGQVAVVIDSGSGQPVREFADENSAMAFISTLAERVGLDVYSRYQVITRKLKKPHWVQMLYWQILEEGESPYEDMLYPYTPYVSSQVSDDPEAIQGIVRALWDPADAYNKWATGLLAHMNSSTHSGWLNKKMGGADPVQLARTGTYPGVVVDYATTPPTQITPTPLSQGHFQMMQINERLMLRIPSINAEMVGTPTGRAVSGRAISARQAGGAIGLQPRLQAYEDMLLDFHKLLLSRIKQFYPAEKIRRILGVAEAQMPLGPDGRSIIEDPLTGAPFSEDIIIKQLRQFKTFTFDLTFESAPMTKNERQDQYERAIMMAGLIAQTGRQLGPATLKVLAELSDIPQRLAEGLARDAMAPPAVSPDQTAGAIREMQDKLKAGRAGGGAATPAGGAPAQEDANG